MHRELRPPWSAIYILDRLARGTLASGLFACKNGAILVKFILPVWDARYGSWIEPTPVVFSLLVVLCSPPEAVSAMLSLRPLAVAPN